jgi:predicted SnoaL-like aldol condensation-catalyzing enzyme
MKKRILLAATLAASVLAASVHAADLSNKDKVVALLKSLETGDTAPIAYINPDKYIQHNLAVGDGLAGFGEVLKALPPGSARADVVRVFEDGDFVFTHTDYNFFGPKVGFDVFRFEDGLIVEHWDNLAEKAKEPNPSGRTQLDGPTEVADLDKTEANKAVVQEFVESVLVKGAFDRVTDFVSTTTYLQHNTSVADGLDGLGAAIKAMAEQGIEMIYTDVHKVLGEGNFVLTISEGTFGGADVSYYDLFRVDDGLIVEHWDVIETLLPKDQWKNDNGKFGGL